MLEQALAPVARAVVDAIRSAIVVIGPDGHVVHANPSAHRVLRGVLAKRSPDIEGLRSALGAADADVTVIRLRGNGSPEVIHVEPQDASSTLAARERQAIVGRLEATGWKLAETARQLGISRTTLWRRLRTYGLTRGGGPE